MRTVTVHDDTVVVPSPTRPADHDAIVIPFPTRPVDDEPDPTSPAGALVLEVAA
jgi:hypothetical protein